MSNLEKKLASLTPEKRALLMRQLKNKNNKGVGEAPRAPYHIPRVKHSGKAPLSYAQQRLWFLDQLEPGSPLYNLHLSLRLKGRLDRESLQKALNIIISRHEALRTVFRMEGDEAYQIILPEYEQELRIRDLAHLPEAEREDESRRMIVEEARIPFELSESPPLRLYLLRLDEEDHVFFMIIHHIIIDGWSLGVFNQELGQLYNAYCKGEAASLPELPIQYADFSEWQRQRLQDESLDKEIEYWRHKLEDAPPLLELPTDNPRPGVKTINGARISALLPEELTQKLQALCQKEQVTLFMTLLAAYQVLLSRYSGQNDIVVGSPIAGRTQSETEALIGFFVNSLVLRTNLSGNPSFADLLRRVQETALEAYDHQNIPFEKLVEKLNPERNLSYTPIYQVAFAFQNMHINPLSLDGLDVSTLEIDRGTATFDLSLFVLNTGQGLKILMEYNTDLFEHVTIERMLGHYQQLLKGIAANPEQPIGMLPLLTHDEEVMMLDEWNRTQADYPREKTLVQLFEQQVVSTPDNIAVSSSERSFTYAQLNERANQLAHQLIEQGVKPGSIIGLCLTRSTEMFVGILGILKAGAAYLPLDPDYPHERLQFMIEDCKVSKIITVEAYQKLVSDFHTKPICIDSGWHEISGYSNKNPDVSIEPGDLCYIIYTSGSTGMPKGVLIEHGNIVHSTIARMQYYPEHVEKFILLSSFSFDSSVAGIFWTLCQGGTLFLPEQGAEKDLHQIAALIEQERPSHMLCLPSAYGMLLETADSAQLASLKTMIVAGESCPPALVRKHMEKLPETTLYNEYGPTEGTVWSTVYKIDPNRPPQLAVPIGRPIQNVQAFVLNQDLQPAPIGVTGELHIAGAGLARGYLNNDVYNRTKFIKTSLPGQKNRIRLYKTGDLVRYQKDGNIVFIGRVDSQVKIRGYRIELGEIEAVLTSHPKIKDAAVIAREDRPGDKRLVAYVIQRSGHKLEHSSITSFLEEKLPAYMIPQAYVFLDKFKLTPNGKVDRNSLPSPSEETASLSRQYVAPTTESEQLLTDIWADVLNLERIGIKDNFFELGGHSLLGVHLLNNVEKATGKRLPIAALFKAPTIEAMATLLSEQDNKLPKRDNQSYVSPWNSLVAVKPHGSRTPFFCIHGRAHSLAQYMHDEQPFYWLHHGQDARRTTYHSVEEIATDHLREIRNVQPHGPYCLGGFSFGGMVAFEVAQQLIKEGEEIELLALFDPTLVDKFSHVMPRHQDGGKLRSFSQRLKNEQGLLKKMNRIMDAFGTRGRRLKKRCIEKSKVVLCKACMAAGMPVPSSVAVFNLIELFKEAASHYEYKPFPGPITMFVPEIYQQRKNLVPSLQKRWSSIAQQGVEFRFVKGATTHHKMVEEPHVRDLVEQLEECLSRDINRTDNPGNQET